MGLADLRDAVTAADIDAVQVLLALPSPAPTAFVLGGVLAPTDPIAATAIMRRVGAPRRINVIEGESLVNDGTALVVYRAAVVAAIGGSFSLAMASLAFVGGIAGGIAVGLVVGWLIAQVRARIDDTPTEVTISLFTGYAAYLPAEQLHVSACSPPSPQGSTWEFARPTSRPRRCASRATRRGSWCSSC